ncbi:hypothetical protein J6590_088029 [Homalodisca vitripennis]|nr:hypothetical protein J6590_088029 [Homalodisca vitripennis]
MLIYKKPCDDVRGSHADMKNWYSPIMMERFGRGVVMSWREKNIKTEEQGSRGREVEKRGSGVLVLVFVCGKISLGVISVMKSHIPVASRRYEVNMTFRYNGTVIPNRSMAASNSLQQFRVWNGLYEDVTKQNKESRRYSTW